MTCPACQTKLGKESLLGVLGDLKHYRCRSCGMMSCKRLPSRNVFNKRTPVK